MATLGVRFPHDQLEEAQAPVASGDCRRTTELGLGPGLLHEVDSALERMAKAATYCRVHEPVNRTACWPTR